MSEADDQYAPNPKHDDWAERLQSMLEEDIQALSAALKARPTMQSS